MSYPRCSAASIDEIEYDVPEGATIRPSRRRLDICRRGRRPPGRRDQISATAESPSEITASAPSPAQKPRRWSASAPHRSRPTRSFASRSAAPRSISRPDQPPSIKRVTPPRLFVIAPPPAARAQLPGEKRHSSSSMPDQRWPRASARSSAASVRARPRRHRRPRCAARRRTAPPCPARGSRRAVRPRRSRRREHPGLRAHREAVEREGEARIARRRPHQRARRLAIRRHRLDAAHQHVEQPLARRLLGHVGFTAGQHLAVELLHVRGEDRERAGELAAQHRERDVGARGDVAEADLLEPLLGEQRHQAPR